VFDICAIINSDLMLEMPENEEDIIENLAYRGILNKEMAEKLRRMKGFRNIVVHRYGKIDDRIAYSILRINLDDLLNSALRHFNVTRDIFCRHMLALLTKDIANLRLIQFHILDYVSTFRWNAK
jgi:hypothetical protein